MRLNISILTFASGGAQVEGQDDFVLPSHHDDLLQMKHKLEDTPFKVLL